MLLLDEPLGALDARIRKQLRVELKAVQEEVGITFVFVTHDQEEALSMSDRLAVMNDGRVEQVGTPSEVYENPATVFVAEFLGVSNLMEAPRGRPRDRRLHGAGRRLPAARRAAATSTRAATVKIVARPERVTLIAARPRRARQRRCPAMVERTVYVGATVQVIVRLATGATMQASIANTGAAEAWTQGTPVLAHLPPEALRVLASPADTAAAVADDTAAVGG